MSGNPAAAYLGGYLQQQYGAAGGAGPARTMLGCTWAACPTSGPECYAGAQQQVSAFTVCPTVNPQCLVAQHPATANTWCPPACFPITSQACPTFQGCHSYRCGGLQQAAAADCKNVLWTAGCTFQAGPQGAAAECKDVMWTAGCTFAGEQQPQVQACCHQHSPTAAATFGGPPGLGNYTASFAGDRQAACSPVTWTLACILPAGQQAAAAECKNVMWTAGCTFAGEQRAAAAQYPTFICAQPAELPTILTVNGPCLPTIAAPCLPHAAISLVDCYPTFWVGCAEAVRQPAAAAECKDVMWTAGCTFAPRQQAHAQPTPQGCLMAPMSAYCTILPGPGLTLAAAASPVPSVAGGICCSPITWTAACTFAGQQAHATAAYTCQMLTTQACHTWKECGTTGCPSYYGCPTIAPTVQGCGGPQQAAAPDCKNVMWTAGCTFADRQPQFPGPGQCALGTTLPTTGALCPCGCEAASWVHTHAANAARGA